jgi:hypothetical protein
MKEREAAGVERAMVSFGLAVESSLGCRLEHEKGIRRIASTREEEREKREVAGYLRCAVIGRGCLQIGGTPARNFLAAS